MAQIFILALAANWLLILPGYVGVLSRFTIYRRPFNCVLCIAFWLAFVAGCVSVAPGAGLFAYLAIPVQAAAASFLAAFINRLFTSLSVSI